MTSRAVEVVASRINAIVQHSAQDSARIEVRQRMVEPWGQPAISHRVRSRDLREQLIELLAELAFLRDQPLPRDAAAFKSLRNRGRKQLPQTASDLARLVRRYSNAITKSKFD